MAILNAPRLTQYLVSWIKAYAQQAGRSTLVVGLSGGVDSALTALLCKKTNLPILGVILPCQSSEFSETRAKALAQEYSIPTLKIDLSSAQTLIQEQVKTLKHHKVPLDNKNSVGNLRSTLRTPALSYVAHVTQGLIVGTGNRSEDRLLRYYAKFGDGCVDLMPLGDLFKSEVYELFAYLAAELAHPEEVSQAESCYIRGLNATAVMPSAKAILAAPPTADLWGPNSGQEDEKELDLTYEEIEWADRENMRTVITLEKQGLAQIQKNWVTGIISGSLDPSKHPAWMGYTGRQREVVAKMHQLEKISRHKYNASLPFCEVRKIEGLVR